MDRKNPPPLTNKTTVGERFVRLVEIMERLRGPEGCPWDRQQTRESPKPYIIEQAYEVLEGLTAGETVVTSANFFVDSETQLKAALARAMGRQH